MWMNMKSNSGLGSSSKDKYRIGITGKRSSIDQQRNTITILPGQHLMIKTIPRIVKTTKDFNDLPISQRKCKLPFETQGLSYLREFSKKGCETECALKKALAICKCIPWYYPSEFTKLPTCEMFGGHCFEIMMADETNYIQCKDQCLRDCQETAYIVTWSYSPINFKATCNPGGFHYQYFENAIEKYFAFEAYKMLLNDVDMKDIKSSLNNGTFCQSYVANYGALVTVESPSTKIVSTHWDQRIHFYSQMKIIGGTMGLFVGMSLISFCELGFFLFDIAVGKKSTLRMKSIVMYPQNSLNGNAKRKIETIEFNIKVSEKTMGQKGHSYKEIGC